MAVLYKTKSLYFIENNLSVYFVNNSVPAFNFDLNLNNRHRIFPVLNDSNCYTLCYSNYSQSLPFYSSGYTVSNSSFEMLHPHHQLFELPQCHYNFIRITVTTSLFEFLQRHNLFIRIPTLSTTALFKLLPVTTLIFE